MARIHRLVLLYLAFIVSALPANAAPVSLTLEKSVAIALQNATTVLKSENDLEFSGERVLQSYAQFLPTLDLAASYGYSWGKTFAAITVPTVVQTRDFHAQYEISTSLNLFNGFFDYASFKSARQKRDSAQFTLNRAKQQIATDVTQSYYQVILDRQLLAIARWNADASSARAALLNEQARVGTTSIADAALQQARADLDRSAVITAEVRLHDDLLLLIQKLRIDPKETYDLEEPVLTLTPAEIQGGESEVIESALSMRTDVKAAQATRDAADWDLKAARADYFPKLNLGFSVLGTGDYFLEQMVSGLDLLPAQQNGLWTQLGNQISYTVQLTLSWNLFDRGLTRLGVSQARVTASNSQIDEEDQKIQVVTQVRQVQGDFASARTQLDAAIIATAASRKSYEVTEGRFKVGASSFIDLIIAQATLVAAQANEAQARINLKFQSKLLEFYKGVTPVQ